MQFPEEILALFEPDARDNSVGLTERYKINKGDGKKVNGVLCDVWWVRGTSDRLEAVIQDGDDVITLILDRGRWTLTVPVQVFLQIVPFVMLALTPR